MYRIIENIPAKSTKGSTCQVYCAVDITRPTILFSSHVYKKGDICEQNLRCMRRIRDALSDRRHFLTPVDVREHRDRVECIQEYAHSNLANAPWLHLGEWRALLFQCLYAIHLLFSELGYTHNNLISENILLSYDARPKSRTRRTYFIGSRTFVLPPTNYIAKISDFAQCRSGEPGSQHQDAAQIMRAFAAVLVNGATQRQKKDMQGMFNAAYASVMTAKDILLHPFFRELLEPPRDDPFAGVVEPGRNTPVPASPDTRD